VIAVSGLTLFSLIDFLGVFAGAVGGAIAARRNESYAFDFVGVLGLGFVSALGGGITRDVLIGHGPPLAFADIRYLITALFGAVVGSVIGARAEARIKGSLLFLDAAALGLFAVAGATRGLDSGLSALPSLLLGITTAVGGGALRDVLSGRPPRIFERGELYAIVAALSAALFLVSVAFGLSRTLATVLSTVTGFVIRLLAVRFGWQTRPIERPDAV